MTRCKVDVRIAAGDWREAVPDARARARRAVRAAVKNASPAGAAEVSVILTDDAQIKALNARWRGQDKPTNVLAFPGGAARFATAGPVLLGDVVLALETLQREAQAQAKPLAEHMSHLTVHGALHLLGFDHERADEAKIMESREIEILKQMGIRDPYRPRAKRNVA